jgi:glucokinase
VKKKSGEPLVLAGDLGGTSFRGALVDRAGKVIRVRSIPVPTPATPRNVLAGVTALFKELMRSAPAPVRTLGLAWKGLVEPERGISSHIGGFPMWVDVPVGPRLKAALGVRVAMENDARSAALGEGWLGRARGQKDFAYVIVGTGIGTGIVRAGRLHRGSNGRAGEYGHTVVDATDQTFRCDCGEYGHWEALAAGPSIGKRARQELASGTRDLKAYARKHPGKPEGRWLADAARAGVASARRVLEETGRWLGLGLYNLVRVEDPKLIVLGGGAAANGGVFLEAARHECASRLGAFHLEPPSILVTSLGDYAGLLGAASLAWKIRP